MTTRESIAAALTGISLDWDGQPRVLTGYETRPAALQLWQGYPDWISRTWRSRCLAEDTWNVFVALPAADPQSWATATDVALEPVRDALTRLGHVSRAEPIRLVFEGNISTPAVNFTLTT